MKLNVIIVIKHSKVVSNAKQKYDAIALGSVKTWRIEKTVIMRELLPSGTSLIVVITVAGIKSQLFWKSIIRIVIERITNSRISNYFVLLIIA